MSLTNSTGLFVVAFYWYLLLLLLLSTVVTVQCQSTSLSLTDNAPDVETTSVINEIRQLRRQLDVINDKLLPSCQNSYPSGWTYLPSVQKYYRVIFELVDWDTADSRCRELGSKSHLVVINDAAESQAITGFLASLDPRLSRICNGPAVLESKYGGYWTSGQRANRTTCGTNNPLMWKPYPGVMTSVSFTNWFQREPNCHNGTEQCFHVMHCSRYKTNEFKWNDLNCAWPLCPLCQLEI